MLACMCVCVRLIGSGHGKQCRGYAAIICSWQDKLVLLGDMLQWRRAQRGLAVPVPSRKAEKPAVGASPAVPPWKHCITLLAVFVPLLAVFVPLLAVLIPLLAVFVPLLAVFVPLLAVFVPLLAVFVAL